MTQRHLHTADLARDLAAALPGLETSTNEADRSSYGRDLWPRHHLAVRSGVATWSKPALVAWPRSTEEVATLVRFAARRSVPVVPFGAGSGVCGGVLPGEDALVLDLKGLASWDTSAARHGSRRRLAADAGVLGIHLEEALAREGLTLGHFPSSILCSTVGGWVATRSAGQCSGYYGKIEDMVMAVECVTGEGEIVTLPRRRYGPDLSALVVGSEGSLAVITRADLRVHAAPQGRTFGAYGFRDVAAGLEAMRSIYQSGLRPAVCRLYDPFDASLARAGRVRKEQSALTRSLKHRALRAMLSRPRWMNRAVHGPFGDHLFGEPLLVVMFERETHEEAERDIRDTNALLASGGARYEGESPARSWFEHRYAVSYRQAPAIATGLFVDTCEVSAPWSKLLETYDAVREAARDEAFVMAHFSHAYPDGCCIYFSFAGGAAPGVSDGDYEASSARRYGALWQKLMSAAQGAGATVSHHHGVGRSKAAGFAREIAGGQAALRSLKRAFDPHGILNPGVLCPLDTQEAEPSAVALAAHGEFELDDQSQLVFAKGSLRLGELRRALGSRLSVRGHAPDESVTVANWLATGAPGSPDPWDDPVDHLVAGISLTLPIGTVTIPRAPRRATGPDFGALAVGARGEFGAAIDSVWLRVDDASRTSRSRAEPDGPADDPTVSPLEAKLTARVRREVGAG